MLLPDVIAGWGWWWEGAVQLLSGLWPYLALLATDDATWGVTLFIVLFLTALLMRGAALHGERRRLEGSLAKKSGRCTAVQRPR